MTDGDMRPLQTLNKIEMLVSLYVGGRVQRFEKNTNAVTEQS
jgi:hypothetical protein